MSNNKNPYFLPIGNSGMMKRWIVDNVDIPCIKHCHTAGVSMSPGTAVYASTDGKIYPYQVTSDALYIGILEDPAYIGKPVTVQYAGYLNIEGSGWVAGQPYYADNGGGVSLTGAGRQVAVGVGTDSIVVLGVGGAGGNVEDNLGVYFVDRRYEDPAGAHVTGFTLASITSTNTSYTAQLGLARRGSAANPYPDPWSARNQALEDLSSGLITQASIVVLSGVWTVGSDDPTKNGSVDGTSPNSGVVADLTFDLGEGGYDPTFNTSSLLKTRLHFFFHPGTELHFINSFFNLSLVMEDSFYQSPTLEYTTSLQGHLSIYSPYPTYGYTFVINNPLAKVDIQLDYMEGAKPATDGMFYINTFDTLNIKVKSILGYGGGYYFTIFDAYATSTPSHDSVPSGVSTLNVEIDDFKCLAATDPAYGRECSLLYMGGDSSYQRYSGYYNGNFYVKNVYVVGTVSNEYGNLASFGSGTPGAYLPFNMQFNVQIDNAVVLVDTAYWLLQPSQSANCSLFTVGAFGRNEFISISAKEIKTEYPMLGTLRTNSQNSAGIVASSGTFRVNINCDNLEKFTNSVLSGIQSSLIFVGLIQDGGNGVTTASSGMIYISGNYKSPDWMFQFEGDTTKTNRVSFSGGYRTTGTAKSTFNLNADKADFLSITDAVLNSGLGSFSVTAGSAYPSRVHNVLFKNTLSNNSINPARVIAIGETPVVNSSVGTFFT